ncbi:MAG: methyltransferase domain-containing protein [Gammaproteobacteria bacterium]|jgi:SAM-dependent methyltransferase|nr:methyltransferase domain-containing protein [Gammaproteobacteria bacterium]
MDTDAANFAGEWLALREPADHVARSTSLADEIAARLAGRDELRIVDLGAGTGSMLRWLSPRLPSPQRWLLIDRDPALLERARPVPAGGEADPAVPAVETRRADLSELAGACFEGADLVTASAWFDLVSRPWIERLAVQLRRYRVAGLFALTVDGRRWFEDPDGRPIDEADDRHATELFNRHQRRAKGLGEALGPDAAELLPALLRSAGFEVRVERSDWQLAAGAPGTVELGTALLEDWARAAAEVPGSEASRIGRWREHRTRALRQGRVGLGVGHVDVLALPGDS